MKKDNTRDMCYNMQNKSKHEQSDNKETPRKDKLTYGGCDYDTYILVSFTSLDSKEN